MSSERRNPFRPTEFFGNRTPDIEELGHFFSDDLHYIRKEFAIVLDRIRKLEQRMSHFEGLATIHK